MPLEEYITEADLKSIIPELSRYLWAEEADYSPQKQQAISEVRTELINRGFKPAEIMPRQYIRHSGITETADHSSETESEDEAARLRYVLDVKTFTPGGLKTFTLLGSNDKTLWKELDTRKAESIGTITFLLRSSYLFYRLNVSVTGGSIDYEAFLCDTGIERLVMYKWLELILLDRFTEENDSYHLKMKYFRGEYETLLNRIRIWADRDGSGSLSSNEFNTVTNIRILK